VRHLTVGGGAPILRITMKRSASIAARCTTVPTRLLRGARWDPAFWHPGREELDAACAVPLAPLGDFIERITYGPILPGRRPEPVDAGVVIVGQREIRPTGLLLDAATVVAEGCPYDPPRRRLRPGDVVLARSGVGTLARKRFTVFTLPVKATVSCFVDLIRLRGISPYSVVTFLRSGLGWPQVERQFRGVGTPNLNFAQIRSLRVPLLPPEAERAVEAAWADVARLHDAGRLADAEARLDAAAADLERRVRKSRPS